MGSSSDAGSPAPSGDRHGRSATVKDVARLAGVSTGLVSMALADHPRVAAATKVVVRRAAEQLDYVPNSVGRALRSRRLGAIAIVIPHSSQHVFSHPYFVEILRGITGVANDHDLTVVLSTARDERDEEAAYLKILRSRRADGVIVASAAMTDPNVARLASSGYPVVFLGREPHDPRVVAVGIDDRVGADQAAEHLLAHHGCRRVAHLAGPLDHRSAADKLEGYRRALHRHGVPFDAHLVVEGDYSEESGARICEELLGRGARIDGIFAANDEMALGALQVLRDRGRHVPGDVALVGYDDIRLARVVQPALTTVHQPMAEIGRVAAERLVLMLDGQPVEPPWVELPVELVVRQSCGC
jgi:DNA-binding LacI/PurR family transcriptional regulator